MAHNIATTNGNAAFAFYGEEPWHKLGTKFEFPRQPKKPSPRRG